MGIFGPPDIKKLKARKNVKGLIKALKDKDEDVRRDSAEALGKIRDKRAVEPLIQALGKNKDPEVQFNAALALGKIGDARAIEPLTQLLHENSSFVSAKSVRDTVEVALARISRGREAVKKGECPICGTNLEFWEGLKTKCSGCKVNLIVEKQQLVAETSVAKSPIYEVGISKSPQTELLQAARMGANLFPFTPSLSDVLPSVNWPQCCCICLEPVGPFDFYEIRKKKVFQNVPTSDEYVVQEVKLKIPYCKNCRHKVKKLFGGESQGVSIEVHFGGITLKFRNPLYVKMFRQANKQLYYKNI